jgi:hypothetical protein
MWLERIDQILADVIVHLGEHVAAEQVGDRPRECRAILLRGQLEQIGDVGGMQRLDQRTRALVVAILDRIQDGTDEFGTQMVVAIELVFGLGLGFDLGKLKFAHGCLP